MKITFHRADRDHVLSRLNDFGIMPSKATMFDILANVEAAFQQQLNEEIDHMINELEDN